jgi:plastocyanin
MNLQGMKLQRVNRLRIAAAGVAALLVLSACSSSSSANGNKNTSAASQPAASSGPKITIKNFGFSGTLTVKAGTTVTVVNDDSVAHTLTDKATHKFDSGNIDGNGGTATFTAPSTPGKYPFGCKYHPEMSGTLTVTG